MTLSFTKRIARLAAGAILLTLIGTGATSADVSPTNALANAGMEAPYVAVNVSPTSKSSISGMMPTGWVDDSSWADVTVAYGEKTTDVHEGKSALQVDYKAKRGGECQMFQYVQQVVSGHKYTLSVWMQGDGKTPVTLLLRQPAAPYTAYGVQYATPTATWTKVTATAVATNSGLALFMIRPSAPMTLCLDDASFTDDGVAPK